jgi:hypothetical protein
VVLRYGLLYGPGTWYSRGGLIAEQAACGGLAAGIRQITAADQVPERAAQA